MHFPKCFQIDHFVLTNSFGLEKIQNLLLYFKYSVLYVQLNNPKATPNFKEPNLVGIIKVKYKKKTFAAVGYLAYLGLSCSYYKEL